jgi:hypothetical protein
VSRRSDDPIAARLGVYRHTDLFGGIRDASDQALQNACGGCSMNPNSKIWRAGQEIQLRGKQGQGLEFTINTGAVIVNGVVHPDGWVLPETMINVRTQDNTWGFYVASELERPYRIPSFEQLVAIIRSWTGDWAFRFRKQKQAVLNGAVNEEENDNEVD